MDKLKKITGLFKALSDENRLKIVDFIRKNEIKCSLNDKGKCKDKTCINDLGKYLKIGLPTVSHHVKELTRAEILITEKSGRWSYLRINPKRIAEITDFLNLFIIN